MIGKNWIDPLLSDRIVVRTENHLQKRVRYTTDVGRESVKAGAEGFKQLSCERTRGNNDRPLHISYYP